MKNGGKGFSRRALGGILAGAVVQSGGAQGPAQPPSTPAPANELERAREALRSQGRTLAQAAAKLPPETEPAFRFEA